MTNNDAVIDCVMYSGEMARCGNSVRLRGVRKCTPSALFPNQDSNRSLKEKECAISMCDASDSDTARMLQVCENGHYMHDTCIEELTIANASRKTPPSCPLCRSTSVFGLANSVQVIPQQEFMLKYAPSAVVSRAMRTGSKFFV